MTTTTTARPRSTKAYKALIKHGLTDEKALAVLAVGAESAPVEPAGHDELMASGLFTEEQARIILAEPLDEPEPAPAPVTEITDKERAEALVAQRGLTFTKGRVYVTAEILKAAKRVLKGGEAEVVAASGKGRVAAVLVSRQEGGDVAIQNLAQPR